MISQSTLTMPDVQAKRVELDLLELQKQASDATAADLRLQLQVLVIPVWQNYAQQSL